MAGRFSNLEFDDDRREKAERAAEAGGHLEVDAASLPRSMNERDAWHHLDAAMAAHRDAQFEAGLRLYTRALREDRTLIRAWVGQVQMLVELKEYHEARVWSDKALELFKNNGDLLAAKAQSCCRLKDKSTALACSDGSLQSSGISPWRWEVRGEVLLARGEKQFDQCFQKALEEPAADWFDRVMIARIYSFYQRGASALKYMQEAMELAPTEGGVWYELGMCQKELGLTAAAQDSFQRCLELRPDRRDAAAALAALDTMTFSGWLRGLIQRWSGR